MDSIRADCPEVSVIISASDNAKPLRRMVEVAKQLSSATEVIVICPGMTPDAGRDASEAGATVITVGSFFTYEEGRAIGGQQACGQILLFFDERVSISLDRLKLYIRAIKKGWNVVMTTDSGPSSKNRLSSREMAYQLLNHVAGRGDLGASSLCKVPYALTRRALEAIGIHTLGSPPLAQIKTFLQGLSVTCIPNKRRRLGISAGHEQMTKSIKQVVQEHAEAINCLIQEKGRRADFPDGGRYRPLLQVKSKLHLRSVIRHLPNRIQGGTAYGNQKTKRSYPRRQAKRKANHPSAKKRK